RVDGGVGGRDLAAGAQGARHLGLRLQPGGNRAGRADSRARRDRERPGRALHRPRGEAVMRLEGEDHPAPAGTFASIEPPASRTILNRSAAPVTALLIGVQPEGGYEPMSWA